MAELALVGAIFAASFALAFTGAVVPGPMFTATVTHARERGWLAGVLVSAGHSALELLMVAVIVFGLSGFLRSPLAARTIAIAGGLFLTCMGVLAALFSHHQAAGADGESRGGVGEGRSVCLPLGRANGSPRSASRGWWRPLLAGIWTSASNPYWTIWWVAVGAGLCLEALGELGYAGVAVFYVGHILADFVWFTAVAAAVGAGRKVMSPKALRRLVQVCGVFMMLFGLFFMARGVFFPEGLGHSVLLPRHTAFTAKTPRAPRTTGKATDCISLSRCPDPVVRRTWRPWRLGGDSRMSFWDN